MENWESKEEVVRLLEQVISPDAIVERNVWLPNLNSSISAKCQCDVVVKNGKPPRETISIVEVQDRSKKVEINMFRGWCEKMRDVGAQHLICVSEKGFPESVKEKAQKMGPTVRLLTLTQLKSSEKWPLDFFSNTIINPRRELVAIFDVEIHYKNEKNTGKEVFDAKLDTYDFQYNDRWMTAKELFFAHLNYLENKEGYFEDGLHTLTMNLPMSGDILNYRLNNSVKNVLSFTAKYKIDILNRKTQLLCSQYKQIEYEESIAWLMEGTIYLNDKERQIKLIFVPEENESYRLVSEII